MVLRDGNCKWRAAGMEFQGSALGHGADVRNWVVKAGINCGELSNDAL